MDEKLLSEAIEHLEDDTKGQEICGHRYHNEEMFTEKALSSIYFACQFGIRFSYGYGVLSM